MKNPIDNMENLYPHNVETVEKVFNAFSHTGTAAVIHAVGTGKSYIAAAVCKRYSRVIVVTNSAHRMELLARICPRETRFRTYASLAGLYLDTDYELIVLDAFRSRDAATAFRQLERLLTTNSQAKVLGLSSSPIHEGGAIWTDEVFMNSIVSSIDMRTAIEKDILSKVTYVSSLYDIHEEIMEHKRLVCENFRSLSWRNQKLRELDEHEKSWEEKEGIPDVIRKYFNDSISHIMVLSELSMKLMPTKRQVSRWLSAAGYSKLRFFVFDRKEQTLEKDIEEYISPCQEGQLKVMFYSEPFKEEYLMSHVDCVIILRKDTDMKTCGEVVTKCMAASLEKKRKPVLLDLSASIRQSAELADIHGKSDLPIEVFEETEQLETYFRSLQDEIAKDGFVNEYRPRILAHYKKYGHLPTLNEDEELYSWISQQYIENETRELSPVRIEIKEFLDDMGWVRSSSGEDFVQLKERLTRYCREKRCQPYGSRGEGAELQEALEKLRQGKSGLTPEQVQELLEIADEYPVFKYGHESHSQRCLRLLKDMQEKGDRFAETCIQSDMKFLKRVKKGEYFIDDEIRMKISARLL